MRDRIEVLGEISVHHVNVPDLQCPMHGANRILGAATRTIAVGVIRKVGLEQRFEYEFRGRLRDPILDGGNAQRAFAAVRFRNHDPKHRFGPIPSFDQLTSQLGEEPFPAARFDIVEPDAVDPGRSAVGFHQGVGVGQDVCSTHLVVQRIETEVRLSLGLQA